MTAAVSAPAARPRRARFHPLRVSALDRLTEDSLAITFAVPDGLRPEYAFRAGQHVNVRLPGPPGGEEVRRTYSLCSTPAELAGGGRLRIGVKELPGGAFSGFAATELAVGDTVDVTTPLGHFTVAAPDPASSSARPAPRWYVGIAAGSGITPVLSLVADALAAQPASRFTVFCGNRYAASVMFAEELADLKDRWPGRLHVVHVLSQEAGDAALLSGRLDAGRLPALLDTFLPGPVDEWFLCGPYGMVLDARAVLADRGIPDAAVHTELFHVPTSAGERPPERPPAAAGEVTVTIRLDGRVSRFTMGRDERVLDAALKVRGELPYSCRGGVCSTCRAKLIAGEVSMAANWALDEAEVAAGYVLTCQSRPLTDTLTVDYDA